MLRARTRIKRRASRERSVVMVAFLAAVYRYSKSFPQMGAWNVVKAVSAQTCEQ